MWKFTTYTHSFGIINQWTCSTYSRWKKVVDRGGLDCCPIVQRTFLHGADDEGEMMITIYFLQPFSRLCNSSVKYCLEKQKSILISMFCYNLWALCTMYYKSHPQHTISMLLFIFFAVIQLIYETPFNCINFVSLLSFSFSPSLRISLARPLMWCWPQIISLPFLKHCPYPFVCRLISARVLICVLVDGQQFYLCPCPVMSTEWRVVW